MTQNLLYKSEIEISPSISVIIPTVGQVISDEENYYGLLELLTSTPTDLMAQLDENGLDFTTISDFELFIHLFSDIKRQDTSLFFGNLCLDKFELGIDEEKGEIVLADIENDIVIDAAVHEKITSAIRSIHNLKKTKKIPAGEEAKAYLLERAHKKLQRARLKAKRGLGQKLIIEQLIVSMVNTEQFKYNYETVKELSIYQFNESVRQILKKVAYDNRMYGVYAGTVSVKDLSPDDMVWHIDKT